MTVAGLKNEIAALQPDQRREIMAYLVGLQLREDEAFQSRVQRRMDDKDPSKWLTESELDRRLESLPDD